MSGVGARRALIAALALLAAVVLAGALARQQVIREVEGQLTRHGLAWQATDHRLNRLTWTGLEGPGLRLDALELGLLPAPRAVLVGASVDLEALRGATGGATGGATRGGDPLRRLAALPGRGALSSLEIRWGARVLVSDLRGSLWPTLDLEGEGAALRGEEGGLEGALRLPLDLPGLRGEADLRLRSAPALSLDLDVPALVLSHPLLAPRPLPPQPLHLSLQRGEQGEFTGKGRFGPAELGLGLRLEEGQAQLRLELLDLPLEDLVGLFGDQVPEAAGATLVGSVGGVLELSLPSRAWRATPRAEGLGADGVVPAPEGLRRGSFTWRAPAAEGGFRVQRAGEGTVDWTPLTEAPRLAAAIIASEDAGFWTHPGYDLGAIQEALDAWAAGEARPRGGSTLTQQLAKNLFLDGDRTLSRKLRELLYALELERRLGKARVLELYLNIVELGPDVYGARRAANAWFLKGPGGLSWREATFLASILPAPRTAWERARAGRKPSLARADAALSNLLRQGRISEAEASRARLETLRFVPP